MSEYKPESTVDDKSGYSRRDFLKVLGATGGIAAVGCTQRPIEKLIPYVVQPDEVIPGVAAWYAGSCAECSAGCGVLVRTREGRALKVEGNPLHPINHGGLCARGQSSVQHHYDPDRIREPLYREAGASFAPISWDDGMTKLVNVVKGLGQDKEIVFVTRPLSGSAKDLIAQLSKSVSRLSHIEYSLLGSDLVDLAAERTFGSGMRTHFDFSKADVVLSVGADFLETWVSPTEFSYQWSTRRVPDDHGQLSYFVQVEPRLSLTAANADSWVMNSPGTELSILKAVLKAVLAKNSQTSRDLPSSLGASLREIDIQAVEQAAGVSRGWVDTVATRLVRAESSLVVAGGSAVSGEQGVACGVVANLINVALGNLGRSVLLRRSDKPAVSSAEMLADLTKRLMAGTVEALLFYDVNPYYTLGDGAGFRAAIAKAKLVVSLGSHLDETAAQANLILPSSSNFESWADSEPAPGVYNLNQPSMQPLYQTQGLGDTLVALAGKLGVELNGASSFHDYLRLRWKERFGATDFEARWVKWVERGGEFSPLPGLTAFSVEADVLAGHLAISQTPIAGLSLLAYPTVNFSDGASANRPWLQELPEPMTTNVWSFWVDIHPQAAHRLAVQADDVVEVRSDFGVVKAVVRINKYQHPNVVALPIGQGHDNYGRYASGVGSNVLAALDPTPKAGLRSFTASRVVITKVKWKDRVVKLQGSDSQLGRGISRAVSASALNHAGHAAHGASDHGGHLAFIGAEKAGGHGSGEERPQMYVQMDHPLYRWAMAIDLAKCTGCSACVVACYAENNVPVVGKQICAEGREMSWLHIERYFDGPDDRPVVAFTPMMCQQCGNAPCEPVCPVYATYHNEEGLNSMSYNRCVGTRYCANNCSYKVRRFNWFKYNWPEPLTWQLNPDVTVREVGVMEKCSFCVQRIREVSNRAKNEGRPVNDGEIQPACASSCPTKAITFGNIKDRNSAVSKLSREPRAYRALDDQLNTQPAINYLARVVNDIKATA